MASSSSIKMEKSEFRVLIKHYFLRKKTITDTKKKLDKYYGDTAPSISMVKKWFTEFRCGRTSTSDAERSGRPREVVTPESINKIKTLILKNRQLKVREIAETVGISTGRVHHILHEYLDMKKLSSRWVPRLPPNDQISNSNTTSPEFLKQETASSTLFSESIHEEVDIKIEPEENHDENVYFNSDIYFETTEMQEEEHIEDEEYIENEQHIENEEHLENEEHVENKKLEEEHVGNEEQPNIDQQPIVQKRIRKLIKRKYCYKKPAKEHSFNIYAKHLVTQLKNLPLDIALICQNEIQAVITKARLKIVNAEKEKKENTFCDSTDQFSSLGSYVATKLRNMNSSQQTIAERLMLEVALKGKMNKLTDNTVILDSNNNSVENKLFESTQTPFNPTNTFNGTKDYLKLSSIDSVETPIKEAAPQKDYKQKIDILTLDQPPPRESINDDSNSLLIKNHEIVNYTVNKISGSDSQPEDQILSSNSYNCICKSWRSKITPEIVTIFEQLLESMKKQLSREINYKYNNREVELCPNTGIFVSQQQLNLCAAKSNSKCRAFVRNLLKEIITPEQFIEFETAEGMNKRKPQIRNAILGYLKNEYEVLMTTTEFNDIVKRIIQNCKLLKQPIEVIQKKKEESRERAHKSREKKRKKEEDTDSLLKIAKTERCLSLQRY